MKSLHPYIHLLRVLLIPVAVLVVNSGCATGHVLTYPEQLLNEADSLFRAGNYEFAKIRYTKIRDNYPGSPAAPRAQYNLGYINVYYKNPFANWDGALREFKRFAAQYGSHELVDNVNSWIRILVVLQSFKQQYDQNNDKIASLLKKEEIVKEQNSGASYEVLLDAVRNCYSEKDTLLKRIQVLNEVIESIEASP